MAPVQRLYRLQFGGPLYTNEQWSCGLHVNADQVVAVALPDLVVPIKAWLERADSNILGAAKLDFVKFNEIAPTTGRYVGATSNTQVVIPVGSGAGVNTPGQNSICISLTTAASRGRGHAGRMYPPTGTGAAGQFGSDGRLTASQPVLMAASAKILLQELNVVLNFGSIVIFSKLAQTVTEVTGVRVGRVVDTVRSRRTSLAEDYTSLPI